MKVKFTVVFLVAAAFVQISTCQEAFQKQLDALNQKIDILMRENTRLSMENAVLRECMAELKDEMKNLKEKSEEVPDKSRVSSNDKRLLMPPEASGIAFSARLAHNPNLGSDEIVAYEAVITNTGNAYNPNHGIFTAPVKGLYMISASICTIPDQRVHLNIVKNGTPVAYLYSHFNGWDLGSQTVVLQMEKGDEVWVKHDPTNDLNGKATLAGAFNTFSGVLVHKMI